MSQSCVMSLLSANLMRGTLLFYSSSTRLVVAAKPVKRLQSLTYSTSRFYFVNQTGPPEIQFPGGSPSEEELPSGPSRGPGWAPLEVPELPNIPELNPSETPPEVTTIPSDPPPVGPPQNPIPDFPVPPIPSPPMPDTPKPRTPETPPDVVPPPPPPPPGIDPPPPMGPTIV